MDSKLVTFKGKEIRRTLHNNGHLTEYMKDYASLNQFAA
jgi:hypothetical protein